MGVIGSNQIGFLLLDGYNILGDTTQVTDAYTEVTEETTSLGVAWASHAYVGLNRATFNQQGFFNDAAGRSNAALVAGGDRVLCYGLEGNALGKKFIGAGGAIQGNYQRSASVATLHKGNADFTISGVKDEGVVLHPLGAETADGDSESASHDGGAQSTDGAAGYLQVTALTLGGYDDVTITILDSADDSTFAELIAFTDVDTAPAAERVAVAGTVERYTAVSWAFNGTGSDPSISFMAGLARY